MHSAIAPNCCVLGNLHLEWNLAVAHWTLTTDEFFTRLFHCPFCGAKLHESSPGDFVTLPTGKRLCFDVDGVICEISRPYKDCSPYPLARDYIRRLKEAGNEIHFQTARYMSCFGGDQKKAHDAGYQELEDWLEKHDFPFDSINFGKVSADAYMDDRGISLRTEQGKSEWDRFLNQLANF